MLRPVYTLILHLVHLLAYVYELYCLLKIRLLALLLWSYDHLYRSAAERDHYEHALLTDCAKQLIKRPQHLCVIIAPESKQVGPEVFRRLFSYALQMGVECVSVYDTRQLTKGYVDLRKLEPPKGVERVSATKCSVEGSDTHRRIDWKMEVLPANMTPKKTHTNGKAKTNGYVNGATSGQPFTELNSSSMRTLKIYQISAKDGHALIAQVCRELFTERHTPAVQQLLKEDRTKLTAEVDGRLRKHLGFDTSAEPDLGIIFARKYCTYGMLPWHIRFTEFHRLSSEQYFNAAAFAEVLFRYSRCEQRWGK